jgi:putative methylase
VGKPAQTRLIRKLELERFLGKVKPHPSPDVNLEQYTLSESTAARVLYVAYVQGDIVGKLVLDLGCGTGRLALGAAYLGAESVTGVDIDKAAIKIATENADSVGLSDKVNWIEGDIGTVKGKFDTVMQNPPFGVQKRTADRSFLEKALSSADAVYSLHNHPSHDERLSAKLRAGGGQPLQVQPSPFLQRFVEERGGRVEAVYALPLVIPHIFDFHTKAKQEIIIDLYVIRVGNQKPPKVVETIQFSSDDNSLPPH